MLTCPQCESDRVVSRDRGKKVGGAAGVIVGAAWGAACAMRGAQVGSLADAAIGPAGSLLGSMTGAALAGLAGGATIGQAMDASFLDNHECLACSYTFGEKPAVP